MKQPIKILMLEDSFSDAQIVIRSLQKRGLEFESKIISTKKEYIESIESYSPDIILSDHSMPQFNSLDALNILKEKNQRTPFILVAGTVTEDFAVACVRAGAQDFILKDRLGRLPDAILNAIEKFKIENERHTYIDKVIAKEALLSKVEGLGHIGSWQNELLKGKVTWSDEMYNILGYKLGEVTPSREAFILALHPDERL